MNKIIKYTLLVVVLAVVSAVIGFTAVTAYVLSDLPDVSSLQNFDPPVTSEIMSRDGRVIAELYEENRVFMEPRNLPSFVVKAFLAAEDSKFYEHPGLDYMGIMRAFLANVREGKIVQGGSTITQQVAKRMFLSPEKSLRRKLREVALAFRLEKSLTKDQILRVYLNDIYMGHGAYGVGAASKVYFGVDALHMTVEQAALLAGLPKAPSTYDPYKNPDKALQRRNYVLDRMLEEGWIVAAEHKKYKSMPVALAGYENPFTTVAPYFSEHIRRELDARYGSPKLLGGGLKITTTMDYNLQQAAQKALVNGIEALDHFKGWRGHKRVSTDTAPFMAGGPPQGGEIGDALVTKVSIEGAEFLYKGQRFWLTSKDMEWAIGDRYLTYMLKPGYVVGLRTKSNDKGVVEAELYQEPVLEGALVSLDAQTGEVLALVGGYNFRRSQFNRASQAKRQAGSSIKPFIYASAIAKGISPAHVIIDSPIVFDTPGLEDKWKPQNYSEKFYGPTTIREALVESRNVVTIKLLQEVGTSYAVDFLKTIGFKSRPNPDLSLALGATEVTPVDMASSYTVFASGGYHREPYFLKRVADKNGSVLEFFSPPPEGEPVMDPAVAYVVTNILEAVITEGTGAKAGGLGVPCAGKTGTTNENRDAWFVGYTPSLVTAVWVGYDDNTTLGSKQTGGGVAAPIWKEYMSTAIEYKPGGDFSIPTGIEYAKIDADTGELARYNSQRTFTTAFVGGTAPTTSRGKAKPKSGVVNAADPGNMDMLR